MNLCPPSAFIHYTTNHLSPKTGGSQLPRWRARLVAQARAGIYSSTPSASLATLRTYPHSQTVNPFPLVRRFHPPLRT